MADSTPIPSPESIEIEHGELLEFAERLWAYHADGANLILHDLTAELHRNGLLHGRSLSEIAGDYGACVKKLLRAARYLAERKVISLIEEDGIEDACRCESCQCQRCFVTLPFDNWVDEALLRRGKYVEACEAAEQERTQPHSSRSGFVYLLRSGDRYKIGITTDVDRRLKQLRAQQPPFPIDLVHSITSQRYHDAERALHERFSETRVHGEWFALTDELVERVIWSMNEWMEGEGQS